MQLAEMKSDLNFETET